MTTVTNPAFDTYLAQGCEVRGRASEAAFLTQEILSLAARAHGAELVTRIQGVPEDLMNRAVLPSPSRGS